MDPQDRFAFDPSRLAGPRPPGISAFMRIRNGEDFLRESVESHIPFFDEIVAVHNACTDATPRILEELRARYPDKLRVIHYEPRVHPVGSEGHIRTPPDSVHSIARYYNFSLAQTRYSVALKLDDDHIAIPEEVERVVAGIRAAGCRLPGRMVCFSGVNLWQQDGRLGIAGHNPFAGDGDHFFFEVNPVNRFSKDRRFETFVRRGLRREFAGILYWHCKYLKADHGFGNYELARNPASRYHKQWRRFAAGRSLITPAELERRCRAREARHPLLRSLACLLSDKERLRRARNRSFDDAAAARRLQALTGIAQRGPAA